MKPKLLLLNEPCNKAKEIMKSVCDIDYENKVEVIGIYTQLTPVKANVPVFCPCTGVDHIKAPKIIHLDEHWKKTEGKNITSTAEHTWSLILQLAKLNKIQLSGKIIGIIGYGRIGQQVCDYAKAFNVKTRVYDKTFYNCTFDQLLSESDIITLHVPLNSSTYGMIGKEQFDMMKPGTLLVNTSRADIVNENDLVEWLKSNPKNKYADDFRSNHKNKYFIHGYEAYDLSTYYVADNFITSNHIGGNCIEAREATDIYIANKIVEYVKERYQ